MAGLYSTREWGVLRLSYRQSVAGFLVSLLVRLTTLSYLSCDSWGEEVTGRMFQASCQ